MCHRRHCALLPPSLPTPTVSFPSSSSLSSHHLLPPARGYGRVNHSQRCATTYRSCGSWCEWWFICVKLPVGAYHCCNSVSRTAAVSNTTSLPARSSNDGDQTPPCRQHFTAPACVCCCMAWGRAARLLRRRVFCYCYCYREARGEWREAAVVTTVISCDALGPGVCWRRGCRLTTDTTAVVGRGCNDACVPRQQLPWRLPVQPVTLLLHPRQRLPAPLPAPPLLPPRRRLRLPAQWMRQLRLTLPLTITGCAARCTPGCPARSTRRRRTRCRSRWACSMSCSPPSSWRDGRTCFGCGTQFGAYGRGV